VLYYGCERVARVVMDTDLKGRNKTEEKMWKQAGAEILEFSHKSDAPPGGTGMAGRRQHSDVDPSGCSGL